MANPTTNYAFAMPTNTDLVKDLPADFDIFGQAVDDRIKALNPETTLGDIAYRSSTADTNTRLPIGTTGQVLTVSGGVPAWATASGEKSILIPQNSATYLKYFTTAALSQDNPVEDSTYYMPFYLPGYAIDRLSIRTGAAFSGTATVRLGLYNASSTTGKPTTVYLDAGTVSCTAASTNYEITISNTPPAGYYYFAFNMQTSATTPEFAAFSNSAIIPNIYSPTTSTVNTTTYQHVYTETGITGAFATAGTLVVGTLQARFFAVRIA